MRKFVWAVLFAAGPAEAGEQLLVGDPMHGQTIYKKECASCHGDLGVGGRTGVALTDSGRLNLLTNDRMYAAVENGTGLKKPKDHTFKGKLQYLDLWDVVAYTRTLHMTLDEFFPSASRYASKEYEIDKFGVERIIETTGSKLQGADLKAAVFTFFNFDGEEGDLTYVPPDPIKLDQLEKNKKSGYLVFLPFDDGSGFKGEIGVGMDAKGVITHMAVHRSVKGADLLNKSLSRFEGMGKKGQKEKFKVSGGKPMEQLAEKVFPTYMRAMETVTMYDREEKERTWADPD